MAILVLTCIAFILLVYTNTIDFHVVLTNYPIGVLCILFCLDIFSRLLIKTRSPERVGLYFARRTKGSKISVLVLCGIGMFIISALINNLAALFVLFPIISTLFIALRLTAQQKVVCLSLVVSMCNLGGAATPIGDLPAILLMDTRAISFSDYLVHALPFFLFTALIIIAFYYSKYKNDFYDANKAHNQQAKLGILAMMQDYKYIKVDLKTTVLLILVFMGMIAAWALLDPNTWHFHYTAIVGLIASLIVSPTKLVTSVISKYDLSPLLITALVLFIGSLVSASPLLDNLSRYLVREIADPTYLLLAMSLLVLFASGLFQAGPAAAIVLPMVIELESNQLSMFGTWVYIVYAASICAGSSMFLWSATAGIALQGQASNTGLIFNWKKYLLFGISNAMTQYIIAIIVVGYFIGVFSTSAIILLIIIPLTFIFYAKRKTSINTKNAGFFALAKK
ncbi:MAG: hypothetical protein GQ581_08535 [Methyloprofundus sp.]|nr:hypothetical protein [Methyloprofundus sp.]